MPKGGGLWAQNSSGHILFLFNISTSLKLQFFVFCFFFALFTPSIEKFDKCRRLKWFCTKACINSRFKNIQFCQFLNSETRFAHNFLSIVWAPKSLEILFRWSQSKILPKYCQLKITQMGWFRTQLKLVKPIEALGVGQN